MASWINALSFLADFTHRTFCPLDFSTFRMTSCHSRRRSRRFTCRSTGPFTSSWWTCFCINLTTLPRRITAPGLLMTRSSLEYTGEDRNTGRKTTFGAPERSPEASVCFAFQSGHFGHFDVCVRNAGSGGAHEPVRQTREAANGPPAVSRVAGNVFVLSKNRSPHGPVGHTPGRPGHPHL